MLLHFFKEVFRLEVLKHVEQSILQILRRHIIVVNLVHTIILRCGVTDIVCFTSLYIFVPI